MLLQLKAIQQESIRKGQSGLLLTAEVFKIIPFLNVVELRKTHGDVILGSSMKLCAWKTFRN